MNFTREPIIETVITPREGCKLVVRNSKGNGQEDYFVDAVEVVSFGHSFFFRSLERPKSFLVPVSDYEILELKETRMVLKNVTTDRSIKIGGGREAPMRAHREPEQLSSESSSEPRPHTASQQQQDNKPPMDRKRDKRRRGRRGRDRHEPQSSQQSDMRERPMDDEAPLAAEPSDFARDVPPVAEKSPSFISKLFPPPPTLIKETLNRHRPVEEKEVFTQREEKTTYEETIFEHPFPTENRGEGDDETTRFED